MSNCHLQSFRCSLRSQQTNSSSLVSGAALPKLTPLSKPCFAEEKELLTKIKNYIIYTCVRAYIIKGKITNIKEKVDKI